LRPLVADLSHHNTVTDWGKVYASGIRGVIHKATQGTAYADPRFLQRYPLARKAGLLWGAYHFGTDGDPEMQAAHFLSVVERACGPDPWGEVLLALDWEPEPNGHTMSADQARRFLELVAERTGQKPVLYGGELLKDRKRVGPQGDSFLCEHRLWLSHYAAKPVLPPGFGSYFLWQYTGDGAGPGPHAVDGIAETGIDLNVYPGTAEDLAAFWVEPAALPKFLAAAPPATVPEILNKAEDSPPIIKVPAETLNTAAAPPPPVEMTKPAGALRTANDSRTVWSLVNAKLIVGVGGICGVLQWLWERLCDVLDVLPAITQDVGGTLEQGEQVSKFLHLDPAQWVAISAAIAVPLLVLAIVRHTRDKRQLGALKEAPAP
jgi:lysozyme